MCKGPVGLGAKRTLTGFDIFSKLFFNTELVEVWCKDKEKSEVRSQKWEVFRFSFLMEFYYS